METIEKVIIAPLKDLLGKLPFEIELGLAAFGAAMVFVLFLISLIFVACSANKKLRKKYEGTTAFLKSGEEITEENVEGLNSKLQELPESVQKDWSYFLEQKDGYPSDYITQRNAFDSVKPAKAGKVFFAIFSTIAIVLTIWLTYFICKDASIMKVGLADFTKDFRLVGAILADFCAPFLVYVIFRFILNGAASSQLKKAKNAFVDFQNALDEKVLISGEEEDEFVSENIGEINAEIENIIANKLNKREIIEIVTVPSIEDEEEIAEPVVEEIPAETEEVAVEEAPVEEVAEEEPIVEQVVAAYAEPEHIETVEEKESKLIALVHLCDELVHDDNATVDDVEQLTAVLYEETLKPNRDEKDKTLLVDCLTYIANSYNI